MRAPRSRIALLGLVVLVLAAGFLLAPLRDGRLMTDDFLILRRIAYEPPTEGRLIGGTPRRGTAFVTLLAERFHDDHDVYRPTVTLSIAGQFLVTGVDPGPLHLVNLSLHLLGGVALFLLLGRWSLASGTVARWIAVALFLVSPIQLEAVTWTAARSDTLSWLFGALALWLRLGGTNPGRRFGAITLGLLAVAAKESAIVFPLLIGLIDLALLRRPAGPKDGKPLRPGWFAGLFPHVLAGALYLGGRALALDGLGLSYDGRETEGLVRGGAGSYLASLGRVFLPLAEGIRSESARPWLDAATAALGVGWGLAALGLVLRRPGRAVFTSRAGATLVAIAVLPFVISVGVNEIGATLVNARGAYTTFAALAAVAAVGLAALPRWLTVFGALALLLPLAGASRPTQNLYLEAHHGIEHSLGTMRAALAEVPAGIEDVVVIGYREDDYLRGGFSLSGSAEYGMTRPFGDRDWRVILVRYDEARDDRPYLFPFPALAERSHGRAAWLHLRRDATRPRSYDFAHEAGWPVAGGPTLEPIAPAPGARLTVDPTAGADALVLRWKSDFGPDVRWRLRLFSRLARLVDVPLPPAAVRRDGEVLSTSIPWNEQFRQFLEWYSHFAWAVVPCDAEGRPLVPSPPVFFEMSRP